MAHGFVPQSLKPSPPQTNAQFPKLDRVPTIIARANEAFADAQVRASPEKAAASYRASLGGYSIATAWPST